MSNVESGLAGGAARPTGIRRSADWGGKALMVFFLALLMAIPGVFVFALIADRQHRAESVVDEVSQLQGGSQQLLGPLLVAPYSVTGADGKTQDGGWYVVSPEKGSVKARVKTSTLHRGLFDVPVYNATADMQATFAPMPRAVNLM